MLDYEKLLEFFDGYIGHMNDVLEFEDKKAIDIMNDNIDALTKSLGKEEALIMKTNSLEKKREEMTGAKTFTEIIDEAPQSYKAQLKEKNFRLTELVNQIKKLNEYSMNIAQKRVDYLQTNSIEETQTYDSKGNKSNQMNAKNTLNKGV